MCKNANNPCPGCKTHGQADAARMFFTDEERAQLDRPGRAETTRS